MNVVLFDGAFDILPFGIIFDYIYRRVFSTGLIGNSRFVFGNSNIQHLAK